MGGRYLTRRSRPCPPAGGRQTLSIRGSDGIAFNALGGCQLWLKMDAVTAVRIRVESFSSPIPIGSGYFLAAWWVSQIKGIVREPKLSPAR